MSPGRRRLGKHGSAIPDPIQSPIQHYNRFTPAQARRDSHASVDQVDASTYRESSFDSRTGQQGYIRAPVRHHTSGTSKTMDPVSLRDHPTLRASDCDMSYYSDREAMSNASRQYLPITISSVNVTVDV